MAIKAISLKECNKLDKNEIGKGKVSKISLVLLAPLQIVQVLGSYYSGYSHTIEIPTTPNTVRGLTSSISIGLSK